MTFSKRYVWWKVYDPRCSGGARAAAELTALPVPLSLQAWKTAAAPYQVLLIISRN